MEHSRAFWRRLRSRLDRIEAVRDRVPVRAAGSLLRRALPSRGTGEAATPTPTAEPATLSSRLLRVRWLDSGADSGPRLQIQGAAWRRNGRAAGSSVTAVTLRSGDRSVACTVEPWSGDELNDIARHGDQDRSRSGFVATVDAAALLDGSAPDRVQQRQWTVRITVQDSAGTVTGPFRARDEHGSAGHLHSLDIGNGCLAQPAWDRKRGLLITVARRALYAQEIDFDGTDLHVVVGVRGEFRPQTALLRSDDTVRLLELSPGAGQTATVHGSLAELPDLLAADGSGRRADSRTWYLQLADADGQTRHVHWQGQATRGRRIACPADPRIAARYGPNGVLRIDVHRRRLVVDDVTVEAGDGRLGGSLTITGECHGVSADVDDWALIGGRHRVPARSLEVAGGRFTAVFGLQAVPAWGSAPMPLPTAGYRLVVGSRRSDDPGTDRPSDELVATLDPAYIENLPLVARTPGNRVRVERESEDRLQLAVGAPLAEGERSRYTVSRLEIMHRTARIRPTDTVLFDSFDGKAANDNTRAVHDELRRRRPDLRPLWTVADLSVPVPDGGEPIVLRSEAWWRALTSSRYVVTNCWMPAKFVRRDHQTVLQTWHGTPLKLLGFDRIGTNRGQAYRDKTLHEVAQWSMLIAQNPFSSNVFRSAYGYQGRMLEIGYPRNDILVTADDRHRAAIRERLGLDADEQVVLYVPTWRENAKGLFSELDFDAVTSALGDRTRLLVRGHANTVRYGTGVSGRRLLDVTLYPDIADLYLVADLMITDYSSTMFDFSVTGKPMIFFAPDLETYSGSLRGTYFDLTAEAPGPVVRSTDEVIAAIKDSEAVLEDYEDAYTAWQRRFNPFDDGHAAERAVDALLGDD